MCDRSKVGRVGFAKLAKFEDINYLISILKKLGHIKIKHEWIKVKTDDGVQMQQIIYIRLATYQEWKDTSKK